MEGTFRGRPDIQDRVRAVVSKFADRVEAADFKKKKRRRKIMAKSIKMHYAEKDDPMFTGRFHVHSVRAKDPVQKKMKKDKVMKSNRNIKDYYDEKTKKNYRSKLQILDDV